MRGPSRPSVCAVVCSFIFSILTSSLGAAPTSIIYQGSLKQSGALVNGTYPIIFNITNVDGSQLYWTSGSQSVVVKEGLYRVELTPTNVDWSNVDPYIETRVNGALLLPREKISNAPYALITKDISPGATGEGDLHVAGRFSVGSSTASAGFGDIYVISNQGGGSGVRLRMNGPAVLGNDNGHALAGAAWLETDNAVNGLVMDVSSSGGFLSLGTAGQERALVTSSLFTIDTNLKLQNPSSSTLETIQTTASSGYSGFYIVSDQGGGSGVNFRMFGSAYRGTTHGRKMAGTAEIWTDGAVNALQLDTANVLSLGIAGIERLAI